MKGEPLDRCGVCGAFHRRGETCPVLHITAETDRTIHELRGRTYILATQLEECRASLLQLVTVCNSTLTQEQITAIFEKLSGGLFYKHAITESESVLWLNGVPLPEKITTSPFILGKLSG